MNALVSCVMPTCDRRDYISAAIACFALQTYKPIELVILDDGNDKVGDLAAGDPRIRYVSMRDRKSTGEKRNICCDLARGEIICHFDDDDWSSPERVAEQVISLKESGKPIAGYSSLLFWDTIHCCAKRYVAQWPGYVCGATLCYLKSHWQAHPFPDKQKGSDNDFIYPSARLIAASQDESRMVARIHNRHTSAKSNISDSAPIEAIPQGFWENERMRLRQ